MNFLVIGESCRDIFTYGQSKRLSPEAPVPVFTPNYTVETGGMAKNVYNNLKSIIEKNGGEDTIEGIFSTNQAEKIRYVDNKTNHYFLRVDIGDNLYDRINLTSEYYKLISSADAVLISDYAKGFLKETDILHICLNMKMYSKLFLDSKSTLGIETLKAVDFLKLNKVEYGNLDTKYSKRFSEKIIVTLGEEGAFHNSINYPSSTKHKTMDVSGAGDTFFAAFAFSFMKTQDIKKSINFANESASQVVSQRGVSIYE